MTQKQVLTHVTATDAVPIDFLFLLFVVAEMDPPSFFIILSLSTLFVVLYNKIFFR